MIFHLKLFSFLQPSDYAISTWLLVGASIQCLFAPLPRSISFLLPIALLAYRILRGYLIATGYVRNPLSKGVLRGRQTWMIPNADGKPTTGASETIVVLVLAASWTHPNGAYSPGSKQIGGYIQKMWDDAEANREKYGFLGNTPTMSSETSDGRPDAAGKTIMYLSYWKTLEGLHKFAHAEAHMKGQLFWEKTAMDKFPHIGVMHETYEVPKGNWENVFHNFRPFGIANVQYPVSKVNSTSSSEPKSSIEWVSGLKSADSREWKTMYGRMGRKEGSFSSKQPCEG